MTTASILVVEDDTSLSEALRRKLFHENYSVMVANDGKQGLEMAFAQHPSVILLDLNLPKLDGNRLLRQLRTHPWGATVPVIILSNESGQETIMQGVKQHAQAYFIKSDTDLETIMQTIADLVT
jgi:DNA-binding response OmpR family regulator